MKALALSDLHSEQRVLDGVRSLLAKRKYDVVFIAGDVADNGDAPYALSLLDMLEKIPTFVIPGNMDDDAVREVLAGASGYVEHKAAKLTMKYTVFGVGGGLRGPFHTPYEYYDDELWPKIKDVRLEEPAIVLSHTPPFGYFDDVGMDVHIGSRSILNLMHTVEPFLLICGHVHEHKGHLRAGNTDIVKLGPAKRGDAAEIQLAYNGKGKSEVKVNWLSLF
ncbi:MAG: metallophosphoesterase [Candidatus Micrarchaeota archaeon]|nr:metallophosphoesterase [Candidatus Micrarchaeota archaeon]